jgi:hypothetical protein
MNNTAHELLLKYIFRCIYMKIYTCVKKNNQEDGKILLQKNAQMNNTR